MVRLFLAIVRFVECCDTRMQIACLVISTGSRIMPSNSEHFFFSEAPPNFSSFFATIRLGKIHRPTRVHIDDVRIRNFYTDVYFWATGDIFCPRSPSALFLSSSFCFFTLFYGIPPTFFCVCVEGRSAVLALARRPPHSPSHPSFFALPFA